MPLPYSRPGELDVKLNERSEFKIPTILEDNYSQICGAAVITIKDKPKGEWAYIEEGKNLLIKPFLVSHVKDS
jgi:hypothetical protein